MFGEYNINKKYKRPFLDLYKSELEQMPSGEYFKFIQKLGINYADYYDIVLEHRIKYIIREYNKLSNKNKSFVISQLLNHLNYNYNLDDSEVIINAFLPEVKFRDLMKLYSEKKQLQLIFLMIVELEIENTLDIKRYLRK